MCDKHLREVDDSAAREDERHVCAQTEQRVELLRLIHRGDLRGRSAAISTVAYEAVARLGNATNAGCCTGLNDGTSSVLTCNP